VVVLSEHSVLCAVFRTCKPGAIKRHLGGMVAVGNAAKLDAATPAATMPSMKIPSTNQRRVRIVLPRNLLPLKA